MDQSTCIDSMSQQLSDFYAERERMETALGFSSSENVTAVIESLQKQLADLYEEREKGSSDPIDFAATLRQLDGQLDGVFSDRSFTVERDDAPWKFKATWN